MKFKKFLSAVLVAATCISCPFAILIILFYIAVLPRQIL